MARARIELRLRGVVQGVGLRPWAAQRARALGLGGWVRNAADGVVCALEGTPEAIRAWLEALGRRPPEAARIEGMEQRTLAPCGEHAFRVLESELGGSATPTRVPPDVPICRGCLGDLFAPANRRYRYPFTHCARCGPRASVLRALPFDRMRTSLAPFAPCESCRGEYEDAGDRRFHAQTIACARCGPRRACEADGRPLAGDPVELAAARLRAGAIVALKGYGGHHLAVDARFGESLARLRKRKGRPAKPFALLVPDLASARRLAMLGPADEALLAGPERAVVIAPRRASACAALGIAEEVAPGTGDLGLLLPHAPLHHLLLFAPGTRPEQDVPRFRALVFTSGNLSGEPTEHEDRAARERLAGIADLFVLHDREVTQPCDDSVFRTSARGPIPIRLSRGVTPRSFALPGRLASSPPLAALGGDLKCAPALIAHGEIQLGAHLGDLEAARSADALAPRTRALAALLRVSPEYVAHDLHPGYFGAGLAREIAPEAIAVAHHHAHAAACLIEHHLEGPALALTLDGAGFGADGTLWGGELLQVTLEACVRLAHLEQVALPGGERAVREPWRMALVWLARAFPEGDAPRLPWHERHAESTRARVARLAAHGPNAPPTSSCGRLFDAAASLLGCADVVSYEGEAAVRLEALAAQVLPGAHEPDAGAVSEGVIPAADLIRRLALGTAAGEPAARLARQFHERLAARFAAAARDASRRSGLRRVVLSGGCFQNRLLLDAVCARLEAFALEPLLHRRLPPNDAGLAVGQAAVAAARLALRAPTH